MLLVSTYSLPVDNMKIRENFGTSSKIQTSPSLVYQKKKKEKTKQTKFIDRQ